MIGARVARYGMPNVVLLMTTLGAALVGGGEGLSEEEILATVRSLHSAIEDYWTRERNASYVYVPSLKVNVDFGWFCSRTVKDLSFQPDGRLRSLMAEERLGAIDKHLVEIARAMKVSYYTFTALHGYSQKARGGPIGGPTLHVPRAPVPEPEHLTPEYRAAWEWMLLSADGALAETACQALASIGEPESLEVMETVYRWVLDSGAGTATDRRILDVLGTYKDVSLHNALETAWRCWAYAKELTQERGHWGTKSEEEPEAVLRHIARAFPAAFVAGQVERAEAGSEYAGFLKAVKAVQQKER